MRLRGHGIRHDAEDADRDRHEPDGTEPRRALGAGRRRLIRQLLSEAFVLSAMGCVTAAFLSVALIRGVPRVLSVSSTSPLASFGLDIDFDWRVVAFTVGWTVATTILFGLAPAVQASIGAQAVGSSRATSAGRRPSRLRAALMMGQVAMATWLLVVAGLASRSLARAAAVDLGLRAEHVFTTSIDLHALGYGLERSLQLYNLLLQRVEQIPGVTAANLASILPLSMTLNGVPMVRDGDAPADPTRPSPPVFVNAVTRGHFAALSIPFLAGRDFTDYDREDAPPVAIVNETLAERLFPGESPVGKRLRLLRSQRPDAALEIVGLVRDSTYANVGEGAMSFAYRPLAQASEGAVNLLVQVPSGQPAVLQAVRTEVQALDPNLAAAPLAPFDTSASLLMNRIAAMLAIASGLVALLLAGLGLYGVMAYLARQRTREIGIRIALGARDTAVLWLIVGQGARWTFAGMAVGLASSVLAAPALASVLYGISPRDPVVFFAIPFLLTVIALAACALPAWRAIRIDPMVALREG
jgi:putative ABC transport system permease protein